jgi:hypothetical protein
VPILRDTYSAAANLGTIVIRAVRDGAGRVTGITAGAGRIRRVPFHRVTRE